jgi:hypothetical protein
MKHTAALSQKHTQKETALHPHPHPHPQTVLHLYPGWLSHLQSDYTNAEEINTWKEI